MKLIAATLLCAAMFSGAQAQTVYRCGNAYSNQPCAQAQMVDVNDARSPAQQAEARRVAADERRLAAEMRHDRLADERATRPAGAASLSGHATVKVAAIEPAHVKKKRASERALATTDFVAFDPSSRKRRGGG